MAGEEEEGELRPGELSLVARRYQIGGLLWRARMLAWELARQENELSFDGHGMEVPESKLFKELDALNDTMGVEEFHPRLTPEEQNALMLSDFGLFAEHFEYVSEGQWDARFEMYREEHKFRIKRFKELEAPAVVIKLMEERLETFDELPFVVMGRASIAWYKTFDARRASEKGS